MCLYTSGAGRVSSYVGRYQEYSMFQYGSACESHSVEEQGNLFKPQASHYCSGTSRHTVQWQSTDKSTEHFILFDFLPYMYTKTQTKCSTSVSKTANVAPHKALKNSLLKNKHVHTPNHKHTNVTMGMPKALSCRAWLFLSQHGTGIHRLDTYTHAKSSLTQSTVICFQAYSHTPVHSNIYTHPHVRLQYACKSLPTEFSCFFPSTMHA
jgi:hypothetical protein